jgi:uncharacterized protein (TIGR01777 family)
MKVVIPGGTGQIGALLVASFSDRGHDVVVLSRNRTSGTRTVPWDGETVGAWAREIDGADVVINLAGRSVNCRYSEANLRAMMDSRVLSTRAVGQAIAQSSRPPRVWLQMSTATIYAHRFDAPNDEASGIIGGDEVGVPQYWRRSIDIARAWEAAQTEASTPRTRQVAMRTAMVMSTGRGGVFDVLRGLTDRGLGGPIGDGRQFVSWIHGRDFARAVDFLIARDELAGPINVASPEPLPQRELMASLRQALGVSVGLPATKWMAEVGAFFVRTDTELVLKSRRVVPKRLLDAGFVFEFPEWGRAVRDLSAPAVPSA